MTARMDEAEVLRELVAREPIFHRPEFAATREDFERMTAPDYWEVGASGRVYPRAWVLDEVDRRRVEDEPEAGLEAFDFVCRRLGESCWLLTYNLVQGGVRKTRRATVWELFEARWRIVYHQGTVISDEA